MRECSSSYRAAWATLGGLLMHPRVAFEPLSRCSLPSLPLQAMRLRLACCMPT